MGPGKARRPGIRFALALAGTAAAFALIPSAASAVPCGRDALTTPPSFRDSGGYEWDITQGATAPPFRTNIPFSTFVDGGGGPRNANDSYDNWGPLFVGGNADPNFYFSVDDNSCTLEDGDRELVFPLVNLGGLLVQRKLFVSTSGPPGARLLELVTNPGSSPVTTSVQVGDQARAALGSNLLTAVRSSSSGDTLLDAADLWAVTSDHGGGTTNNDSALAHVFDGPGGADRIDFASLIGAGGPASPDFLHYRWDGVQILPGQTAAFISYEVQQNVVGANAATEDANAAAQASAYQSPALSLAIFAGMSKHEVGSTRNWKVTQSCLGKTPTIVGTEGRDVLTGTNGPDVILSYEGNDKINGLAGKDRICGSEGNDKLVGGKGNDKLFGSNGKDKLFGGKGNDRLTGANGKDQLFGGKGKDQLVGGPRNDACNGGPGRDVENSC